MSLGFPSLFSQSDIYLVPLCILVIYAFCYYVKKKYNNQLIGKYFMPALTLRLIFTIIYAVIIQFYYGGQADTNVYYQAVMDMHNAVLDDGSMVKAIYLNKDLDF